MDKIRIGNDIHIEWSIFRDDQPEVFEGKDVEVRLIHPRTRDVMPLEWVISDGVVSATFYGKDQIDTGDYKLMLVENNGAPNMATIDECKAFTLVQCSCQEQKEKPSTSLQLYKVQLVSSFALSGGGNISVEGYPNVDELEEVKELSGDENIIITDSEGNKKTTIGNLKEYVVKDISELPPFRIFENESDYNAVKDELGDCVVCLRDTGVMLYHVYSEAEDGEEGGGEIEDKYIRFADAEVQRICAENWGDGAGITNEQVEAVTDIGAAFAKNTGITSFDEFARFKNVAYIDGAKSNFDYCGFINCSALRRITLPEGIRLNDGAWVEIEGGVFVGSSVEYVGNLDKVSYIGNFAFLNVSTLSWDGVFKSTVISNIGVKAFLGCANFKAELILPNLVKLGQYPFCKSGVKRVLDLGSVNTLNGGWPAGGPFGDFYNCPNLELVILPSSVATIKDFAFRGSSQLSTIVIKAVVPPTLSAVGAFEDIDSNFIIYVPDASVEAYKTATNWSQYSSRIKGISELPIDNPTLYDEIKDYLN